MTLQASGAIALSQIQAELGGANPISLSEYYRGGAYTGPGNTSVPTSGAISMSNFYGAENAFELVYSNVSTSPFAAPTSATADTITVAWTAIYQQAGAVGDPTCTGAGFVGIDDYHFNVTQFEDTGVGHGHISWFNGAASGKNPFTSITNPSTRVYAMSVWRKPTSTLTAVSGGFWKSDDNLDDTITRWGTSGQTLCMLWCCMPGTATPQSTPINITSAVWDGVGAELIQDPTSLYWGMTMKVLDTSVTPSPFVDTNDVGASAHWRTSYIRV